MFTPRRALWWAFGLLLACALFVPVIGAGPALSAAARAPLSQYAADHSSGLPADTATPTVEPEYAILDYVKANNPSWTCDGPFGKPGHRYLYQCNPFGYFSHPTNGIIDRYNSPDQAQAEWQYRRENVCPSFPICLDTIVGGYQAYEAGYVPGTATPVAYYQTYTWGSVWLIGAVSLDDTQFRGAPPVANAIIYAANALGYLPPGTYTPVPNATRTPTRTPTAGPTATSVVLGDLTGTISWTRFCNVVGLRLTTIFTAPGNVISNNSVMRIENSVAETRHFPVPPLPSNTSYTVDCAVGDCVPSDWIMHLPITLTVDVFHQVIETNEGNNTAVLQYPPPPEGTPCAGTPTTTSTPTATPSCTPSWQQVPSLNASSADNYLLGVSALAPDDVWAVGYYSNTVTQRYETLTEHWNGSAWAIVPSPNPAGWHNYLRAVDAIAWNDVWAVGDALPNVGYGGGYLLTFHWDGAQWTAVPNPNPGFNYANGLSGVIALASNDVWATGFWRAYSFKGLLMHWNGSAWVQEIDPSYQGGLASISGVAASDLWAVGQELGDGSLIYHRDSNGWSRVSSPDLGGLRGVSALASNDVWAVGQNGILRWNGTSWVTMTVPVGNLLSVDARAVNDVWVLAATAILHWDGSAWTIHPTAAGESLVNLDARTADDVWVVGNNAQGGVKRTLVERYTAGGCNTTPTPVTATATPTVWATATTGALYDLTGTAYWTSVCPAPVLRLTTLFTASENVTANNSVMRITNSVGQTRDVPVPPLPANTSYTYDCMVGDCVPSDWVTHIPITLTVDVFNQVSESNENNNTFVQPYPPPMPTPCAITPTPTSCPVEFTDVPPTNTFYPFVHCLACRGIVQGYADGTFRPDNTLTRGQLAKIVSNAAGYDDEVPPDRQTFEDVPPGHPFWLWIERIYLHFYQGGIMLGYQCGGPNEPCVPPENRPYFRPYAGATRGQLTKIASEAAGFNDTIPETQYTFADMMPNSTFWVYAERLLLNRPGIMSGYPCGGPGEPCDSENRPYFRPNNGVTRGQASKIVANTFFPGCNPP